MRSRPLGGYDMQLIVPFMDRIRYCSGCYCADLQFNETGRQLLLNAPRQQLSLANQLVDGGAHERYGLIAISTPSPLTRQVHIDER